MFEKVTNIFAKKKEVVEEQKVPVTIDGVVTMVPKSQVAKFVQEQREAA